MRPVGSRPKDSIPSRFALVIGIAAVQAANSKGSYWSSFCPWDIFKPGRAGTPYAGGVNHR